MQYDRFRLSAGYKMELAGLLSASVPRAWREIRLVCGDCAV